MGAQYVGLEAGGADTYLSEGAEVEFTQSAIVLEQLIGKYLLQGGAPSPQE